MSGSLGWVVAVVVAVVAVGFYFYPEFTKAPTTTEQAGAPEQQGAVQENIGDPQMQGLWQSQTDVKFTREIRADGTVIDRYEGDASAGSGGEWATSDAADFSATTGNTLSVNLQSLPVIKVVWEGGVETTFFVVNKLDASSMTTTDLSGKGTVTVYNKITQLP